MDFLQRNANNQPQAARNNHSSPGANTNQNGDGKRLGFHEPRWLRITFVVLLFSMTILAVAIAVLLYFGKDREGHYIDEKKAQAVFLTNGQVYFGNIAAVTDEYIDLQNIYYLNSQQQPAGEEQKNTAQQNFALVKLGCELHGPTDQMIINREQVSFWENLKSDGKVSKAIQQWIDQNPDGQNCDESANSNSTQQSQGTEETQQQQ